MKYATIAPRGRILNTSETEPADDGSDFTTVVEITDEQYATIEAAEPNFYFLIEGELVERTVAQAENRLAFAKVRKKKVLANARYKEEFEGFQLPPEQGGMFVRTDGRTRTLLNGGAMRASLDPAYEINHWKTADGSFVTLSSATIIALSDAVESFIGALFAKEEQLGLAIDACATEEEVNAINW